MSRQTVKNILKEHDIDPGPLRGKGTWDEFLKIHANTHWQCDFATKKMWTIRGFVDLYFLVFIHLGTRRCWISPSTMSPESAWVCQQARNFLMHTEDVNLPHRFVMRDNDAKYSAAFDAVFADSRSAHPPIRRTLRSVVAGIARILATSLDVSSFSWHMCDGTRHFRLFNHGDTRMTTRDQNSTEKTLRNVFRTINADQAQAIREAYYKAVEGLQRLAEMLEIADLEVGEQNDHALIEEHVLACTAMETMNKSLLGRIL
ncbi:MAG: Integrase core domain protein [Planctomycetaceae bacterium]|nr:Integrase core domain protein [Planctomycetaceae bacterium]